MRSGEPALALSRHSGWESRIPLHQGSLAALPGWGAACLLEWRDEAGEKEDHWGLPRPAVPPAGCWGRHGNVPSPPL